MFSRKTSKTSERGVSLFLTFMVMTVIFSIAVEFSVVVLREVQITSGASYSSRAIYIADAGAEKLQYLTFREGNEETPITISGFVGPVSEGGSYLASSENLDACPPAPCLPGEDEEIDVIKSEGTYRGVKRKIEINLLP